MGHFLTSSFSRINVRRPSPPRTLLRANNKKLCRHSGWTEPSRREMKFWFYITFFLVLHVILYIEKTMLQIFSLTNAKPYWHLQNFKYHHFKSQSNYFYNTNINVGTFIGKENCKCGKLNCTEVVRTNQPKIYKSIFLVPTGTQRTV